MSLHIVIGIAGKGATAKPFPVYVGRSGSEALAAREANTTAESFVILSNVVGVRKHNPRFSDAAPPAPKPIAASTPPVVQPSVGWEKKPAGKKPAGRW